MRRPRPSSMASPAPSSRSATTPTARARPSSSATATTRPGAAISHARAHRPATTTTRTAGAGPYFDYFGSAAGARGQGLVQLRPRRLAHRGPQLELLRRRRLRQRLAAAGLAAGGPGRAPVGARARLLAPSALQLRASTARRSSVQRFWEALYAAGADIVLNGHDHDYERFAPAGPVGPARPDLWHPGVRRRHRRHGAADALRERRQQPGLRVGPWRPGADPACRRIRLASSCRSPARASRMPAAGRRTAHRPRGRAPPSSSARTAGSTRPRRTRRMARPRSCASMATMAAGADYRSYLKFRAVGLSGTVFRAAIRLWVTDATPRWPGDLADVDELVGQDADLGEPPRARSVRCSAMRGRRRAEAGSTST